MVKSIRPKSFAFTDRFDGIAKELVTEAGVSLPFDIEDEIEIKKGDIYMTRALWDTGATGSVITTSVVKKIGLKPITQTKVIYGGNSKLENVYYVNIYLPNYVVVPKILVTECSDKSDFEMIIGMDIICYGDFAITNLNNKTTFSFNIPSFKTIDFEKESTIRNIPPNFPQNKSCPCKSGKLYKRCHGKK